jgi:TolB-like protein/Flp pilus assembly protein TadD
MDFSLQFMGTWQRNIESRASRTGMTQNRIDRRMAAILAADVVGYSRLMGQDEEGTLAQLRGHRRDLMDPAIAARAGRIFKTTGDGLLAEFASVIDAVRCAVEIQSGMARRNAGIDPGKRLELRIGINLGDVILEGGDVFGDVVNIAARLEGIADAGEICISDDAYRHVREKVDVQFTELGELTLKNIARPVRAHMTQVRGEGAQRKHPRLPEKPSIAILPLQNMSGDPEQEYFADGIVEDITTALSRFRSLFVIARNSSFTYKGRSIDVRQVGRELGVRYVLEGSVRRTGGKVRITGQLIDATTGAHLWADRIDGDVEDVFALQDRVTNAVVGAIIPRVEEAEIERAQRKPTHSLDAYDCYLRGVRDANELTRETNESAFASFLKAIDLDPGFSAAYAKAAYCINMRKVNGWMLDRESESAEACRLARRAVELGKDDAATLALAGYVLAYVGGELDAGAQFIARALALNPNLAEGWASSSWIQVCLGDPGAALEHVATAMRLSPADPRTYVFHLFSAMAHLSAGRYGEAAQSARRVLHDKPVLAAMRILGIAEALDGRLEEARTAIARMSAFDPTLRMANIDRVIPPYRREADRERYLAGLRMAGLPE